MEEILIIVCENALIENKILLRNRTSKVNIDFDLGTRTVLDGEIIMIVFILIFGVEIK